MELSIEEEGPSGNIIRTENVADSELMSTLGPEITPLEEARIEIFQGLIAFVKTELRFVSTIEWEEIIYFQNVMMTPVLMEKK